MYFFPNLSFTQRSTCVLESLPSINLMTILLRVIRETVSSPAAANPPSHFIETRCQLMTVKPIRAARRSLSLRFGRFVSSLRYISQVKTILNGRKLPISLVSFKMPQMSRHSKRLDRNWVSKRYVKILLGFLNGPNM